MKSCKSDHLTIDKERIPARTGSELVESAFAEIQQLDIRVATAEAEEKNKCRTVKLDVLVD